MGLRELIRLEFAEHPRNHPEAFDQEWANGRASKYARIWMDLAAVSMSRSTFADRFRAATGETPMQNVTRYRMARAAEYLRGTNAGIREIARLVGYDSEVSVTKAFHRYFGISPGAYRKAKSVASDAIASTTPD